MASGDTLMIFTPLANQPPAANFATLDLRNSHPVLDFDAATDESAVFGGVLPRNYAGGGVNVIIAWMASSATANTCMWSAAWERHQDETDDLDSDSFASPNSNGGSAPTTNGTVQYTTIPFANGAAMDSLAVGESFRLKITRDADNASDTMTGDAELLRVEVQEQ